MKKHIIIIGGVAGGATTAARLRRLDEEAEITIIEKGGDISYANCGLPYHISGEITDRESLVLNSPQKFWQRFKIRVRTRTLATKINPATKTVDIEGPDGITSITYDELVLAQGANPIIPKIEGAGSDHCFTLATLGNMDSILSYIDKHRPKTALVVGGGFIGVEVAESLIKLKLDVSIVEFGSQILGINEPELANQARRVLEEHQIKVFTRSELIGIDPSSKIARLKDGRTPNADLVVFAIGGRPNSELATRAGIKTGPSGGVMVDEFMTTNIDHIWAVGDMVEVKNRVSGLSGRIALAGPANRQARICASNIMGGREAYKGGLGTSVIRIFDHSLASTGLNQKTARELGLRARTVTIHKDSHASYFPGSEMMSFKLVFDEKDGTILGAHAFGKIGVEKRIDVVATAIAGGLSVNDLIDLDLAYAPMYNTANDLLQVAAMSAQNHIEGLSPMIEAEDFAKILDGPRTDLTVLDVRTKAEFGSGHVPGAVNIAVDDLRDNLARLTKPGAIYVYCKVGYRGNLATRLLLQAGFKNVTNVSGGYVSIQHVQGENL